MIVVPILDQHISKMKGYKFRSDWSDEKSSSLLTRCVIYFASPGKFNDPYDCKINMRYDLEVPSELLDHMKRLAVSNEPQSATKDIDEKVRVACDRFLNPDCQEEVMLVNESLVNKAIGVFSLAGAVDNNLLWSHYSDSHKGFCIEYDLEVLQDHFAWLLDRKHIMIEGVEVAYVSEYPNILVTKLSNEERFYEQVRYKCHDWCYEKEYRFVGMYIPNTEIPIPSEAITSVILGYRSNDNQENGIKDSVSKMDHKPKLMKAKRNPHSFDLEFVQIEY